MLSLTTFTVLIWAVIILGWAGFMIIAIALFVDVTTAIHGSRKRGVSDSSSKARRSAAREDGL